MSHQRRITPFLYESPTNMLKLEIYEKQNDNNGTDTSKKQQQ